MTSETRKYPHEILYLFNATTPLTTLYPFIMADVSIQNARMHTRMLRTRYHPRNKIRMIPPKLQPLPPQHRSSNANVSKPRTKIPQLSQLTYKTRQRRRRMLEVSKKNNPNPNRSHPHPHPPRRAQSEFENQSTKPRSRNNNRHHNTIMKQTVSAPKASSLPVIIPKLRLKPIRSIADRSYPRHQSEPISSVNTSRRNTHSRHTPRDHRDRGNMSNRHDVVLPKLQCLKSHRNRAPAVPPKMVSFNKLSQQYFELTFLLRSEMSSVRAFHHTQKVATESLKFLSKLTEIAQSMGVLRGTLSRALLPFDSNTSVSDQANTAGVRLKSPHQRLLSSIDFKTQQTMKCQAIALRQLVKVKIADDADLDQAKSALLTVQSFCSDCQTHCSINDMKLKDMLQKLKEF